MAVKKTELYSVLWEACNKLRGGVEPSRYKDYVLVLLFFKYVSDKYKGQPYAEFVISEGGSFDDLIKAKKKKDVGEKTDKIIQKFLEDNKLIGLLPDVSFNNPEELGSGQELVDKVSGLIALFENPALDFKNNRASGDDIIGDAYEYFMMKFAQESGKSKGQFYTPSEVSRVIARLIGIGNIKKSTKKHWTLYDPAAGSGSLLIRAADEAPVDKYGNSIVSIFGQEKYPDTAGLAKMNFILHNKGTGEIKSGSTISSPQYLDSFGQLRKFDFIVMNPPFSDKTWTDGIKPEKDIFKRFDGYDGVLPPEKNGDYTWFLHVLKSLDTNGKAGIVMPHGVLFRGNSEETIRNKILEKRYIKAVVSLPGNLFYGTGIPACIIIIDKEDADSRTGVFLIDASRGFKKDGNKNRLREQDIEKIVRTYNSYEEISGYSRFVTYKEIIDDNGGNLNIPRYIQKIDDTLPQNISAHLLGGIPGTDIDSLNKLWDISPRLKDELFVCTDKEKNTYNLVSSISEIEKNINQDESINEEKEKEVREVFVKWKNEVKDILLGINTNTDPKALVREISNKIWEQYKDVELLDNYDIYDCLLNYWNNKLQDDVYAIKTGGYEICRDIDYEYAQKKTKDENGETISVDDTTKVKSFEGAIIPKEIIENEYFRDEADAIRALVEQASKLDSDMDEMREEESGDEGLLKDVLNEKGDGIPKANLSKRIKELDEKKSSEAMETITTLISLFDEGKKEEMEAILSSTSVLEGYDIRNNNGALGKNKLKAALKLAVDTAELPGIYRDEYEALMNYSKKQGEKDGLDKSLKEARKILDEKVQKKYAELIISEIKHLLFDIKWMGAIELGITEEIEQVLYALSSRVLMIAKRYEQTLSDIESKTSESRERVATALGRMGYKW